MIKTSVITEWKNGMHFSSIIDGHQLNIDAHKDFGGEDLGPSPKKLLLSGLAGCTGMDVVSILKKMKLNLTFFNIIVNADLTEEHPKFYKNIEIVYQFKKTDNLSDEKVKRAIELSQEQYCGVAHMFRQFATITHNIEYLD
ncbi:MAG: OsmC family protein [Bacteroidales bacterium]|nr:OsmC family protein [Bacteroidales bacterium]